MRGSDHFWTGPRQVLVHRLVRHRLPVGSLVVDAAWNPGSPLAWLAPDFPTLAVTPEPRGLDPGRGVAVVQADVCRLPVADASVDAVLLLDVLERMDDDGPALESATRALRSGGLLMVAVPHDPRFWSAHDERAGHRRRYTGSALAATFRDLGMVPEHLRYFQFLLLPLFAANRRRSRRRPRVLEREAAPGPGVNRALAAVNRLEVESSTRLPWPTGSTVLALGRKP
ncbi:MAG: class I SAM-dependent methyltransferase [Acidimicrobiales bacterium]